MHITIISLFIISFSLIILCLGPMINRKYYNSEIFYELKQYDNVNCQYYFDEAENIIKSSSYYDSVTGVTEPLKKEGRKCLRFQAMKGLEYTTFIFSFSIGFMYLFLNLRIDNNDKRNKIGSIISSLATSLGILITIFYIGYSGYIFTKDPVPILKTDSNAAFAKYNEYSNRYSDSYSNDYSKRYILLYPKKDEYDTETPYIKFKDLGKKQYNYNKEFFHNKYFGIGTEFHGCQYSYSYYIWNNWEDDFILRYGKTYTDEYGYSNTCKYLYYYQNSGNQENKHLFGIWLTSLLMACFIILLEIILIICYCLK